MKKGIILLILVQLFVGSVLADFISDYQESVEIICQNHLLNFSDIIYFHDKSKIYNSPVRIDFSRKHQGFGLFAARNIKQGELIMAEAPLLEFDNEVFNKSETEFEQILQSYLALLADCDYNEFLTLANAFVDEDEDDMSLTGIVYSNVFDLQNKTGLFLKISRINHSCKPSVQTDFDGKQMRLNAARDIMAGEELHISYVDTFSSKEERQEHLFEGYGFECDCELCSANKTKAEQIESDANRKKLKIVTNYEKVMAKSPLERLELLETAMEAAQKERLEDDPLTIGSIYFFLLTSLSEIPKHSIASKYNSTLLAEYAFGNMSAIYGPKYTKNLFKSTLPKRVYLNFESTVFKF